MYMHLLYYYTSALHKNYLKNAVVTMQCNAVTDQCQWPIGAQLGQSRIVEPDQRDESSFPYCIRIDANSIPPISLTWTTTPAFKCSPTNNYQKNQM